MYKKKTKDIPLQCGTLHLKFQYIFCFRYLAFRFDFFLFFV